MTEVMGNPDQPAKWKAIAAGEKVDWEDVFAGYISQVDWPGAAVWQETAKAFPDAKVIHTERPEDAWWNSFSVTIGKFFSVAPTLDLPPHFKEIFATMSGWFLKETFGDHTDRDAAIAAYRLNNQRVRDEVPAERLLVFNVADGWDPLCRFLEVPAPAAPFPRSLRATSSGPISAASRPEGAVCVRLTFGCRHGVSLLRFLSIPSCLIRE